MAKFIKAAGPANVSGREEKPATPEKASPDPSKAGTRENLNTTFGSPNEDK